MLVKRSSVSAAVLLEALFLVGLAVCALNLIGTGDGDLAPPRVSGCQCVEGQGCVAGIVLGSGLLGLRSSKRPVVRTV